MIRNKNFEIITIAEEFLAIPVGEEATTFHGVVTLNEAAAFLLERLDEPQTMESLIGLLLDEYDVDRTTAEKDVNDIVNTFLDLKLILEV